MTSTHTPSILVVCTGNICRSAIAEVVLADRARARGLDVAVDSAGISSEEQGNPIDPRAAHVLEDAGYAVPPHSARQVRDGEIGDYDLVLAMTGRHRDALRRQAERDGVGADNIHLWREYDPERDPSQDLDVPDPWYGTDEDFVATLAVVESAADGVLDAAVPNA